MPEGEVSADADKDDEYDEREYAGVHGLSIAKRTFSEIDSGS
jgi:hypothetical protein